MALDGKVLARAKSALADRRKKNEERYDARVIKAYSKNPKIRELDLQLRQTMTELAKTTFTSNSGTSVDDIKSRNLLLQDEIKNELVNSGFSENYLDNNYICEKCSDTGFVGTSMCGCLEELYRQEQKQSLSNLFKLGDESFDNFKLSYYSETLTTEDGRTHRNYMESVRNICYGYAHNFEDDFKNLLFIGKPGLGKTYLSACIARVVSENGHSVVYDMATAIFSKFEYVKFSKSDDLDDVREEIKRYFECDLLIFDDLGTELTTAYTITALYELINMRLITGKKTIISSNLTIDELCERYSEQTASRLKGEFKILPFVGDDIRMKKNMV